MAVNQKIVARSAGLSFTVGFVFCFASHACQAGLLSLQLSPPVISSANGSLSYNAISDVFHSETIPALISDPSLPGGTGSFIGAGNQMTIDLLVDHNGSFVSSGTGFTMMGNVDLDNDGTADASGLLLSGTIIAFGADAAGPPSVAFDGLFAIQGGALTHDISLSGGGTLFGGFPLGRTGGFSLAAEDVVSGILGNFAANFASSSVEGNAGLLPVPEPSSFVLGMTPFVGFGLMAVRRRKQRRQQTVSA